MRYFHGAHEAALFGGCWIAWRHLQTSLLQNKQERPLPYQRNAENQGHGFWPQAKAPIPNQPLAKSKALIVPSDVCSVWEGKCPVLCSLPVVLCHTGISLFFCFSHQAHISYRTSQAGLSCILKAWCFIVQNPCSWLECMCFVEVQVVITQVFPSLSLATVTREIYSPQYPDLETGY